MHNLSDKHPFISVRCKGFAFVNEDKFKMSQHLSKRMKMFYSRFAKKARQYKFLVEARTKYVNDADVLSLVLKQEVE